MAGKDKIVSLRKKNKDEVKELKKQAVTPQEPVICSFCGRPNTEVMKMVKGPGVNICSECTMIAVQYLICNDRMPSEEAQKILELFWGSTK